MKEPSQYNRIRELVEKCEIEKALKILIEVAESMKNRKVADIASLLKARNTKLKDKVSKGLIEFKEELIEQNSIMEEILKQIRNLEEYEKPEPFQENNSAIIQLSEEELFKIVKTAIIVIELEKIKEEFYNVEWKDREDVLRKLFKFSDHNTMKLSQEVITFLVSIAHLTRSGMNSNVAYVVESLIIYFFPHFELGQEGKEYEELAFQCIQIGDSIFYGSTIYLKDLKVGVHGLQILKWIYWRGKERGIKSITDKVKETYQELESTLNRPKRNDLAMAKELLSIFKNDLDSKGLDFPIMPNHLLELV